MEAERKGISNPLLEAIALTSFLFSIIFFLLFSILSNILSNSASSFALPLSVLLRPANIPSGGFLSLSNSNSSAFRIFSSLGISISNLLYLATSLSGLEEVGGVSKGRGLASKNGRVSSSVSTLRRFSPFNHPSLVSKSGVGANGADAGRPPPPVITAPPLTKPL